MSLIFAQLTHALGLNDVCDALRLHSGPLAALRGASGPSKNGFSTANRERPAQMAQDRFWRVLEHLQNLHPGFGARRRPRFAFRFKRTIHLVDATTIQLIARCLDWARHRRRKAAAKCHLRLGLQTFLPRFALVGAAGWLDGPQLDIHPPGPWRTGFIYDETRGVQKWIAPSLPKVSDAKPEMAVTNLVMYYSDDTPAWNELEISARGTRVRAVLNGVVVRDWDGAGVLDDAKHRERNVGLRGHLALQIHKGDRLKMRFREICLRELGGTNF